MVLGKRKEEILTKLYIKPVFNGPGSPWENGHFESLNGKIKDELLNEEIFDAVKEAKALIYM